MFKIIKYAIITIVIAYLFIKVPYFKNTLPFNKNNNVSDLVETSKVNNKTENNTNILLFGDSTDAMMVATIDKDTYDINLKSLDNNTYSSITDKYDLLDAIEKNTNIDIDKFIQIDFKDLMNIVSALEEIEVNISEEDKELINNLIPKYFAEVEHPKGYEMEKVKSSGKQKLNSYQALAYANVIADDSTKQKEVITSLINKVKNLDLSQYPKLYNTIKSSINTNLTFGDIVKLASSKLISK